MSYRLRVSAHVGYLFPKQPLAARFAAAREAGFRAVEIQDPYSLSLHKFRSLIVENNLEVAQIVLPNGRSGASKKGYAALPDCEPEFEASLMLAIDFARAVGCPLIHPMAGLRAGDNAAEQWSVYLSNLSKASSVAADEGLSVVIEPISPFGTPNYFMNSFRKACAAVEAVGAPNLLLSLDTYHAAAMGVHLRSFVDQNSTRIGHVQLADWPNRNEPGSGQVDFEALLSALRAGEYKGYVGLEYMPSADVKQPFGWLQDFDAHLEPLLPTSRSSDPTV